MAAAAQEVSTEWPLTANTRAGALTVSQKWSLRSGNKIVIRPDPKKKAEEIITILRFEPQSDRTFLYVRYDDGSREKWMK